MEKWTEKTHQINTYNPECKDPMDYYYNVDLSENMSILTNFFLNTAVNVMDKKNLIVTFPDNILRPLPLLAYIYSFLENKSSLVFTSNTKGLEKKTPREIHNLNYYMLNWDGEYLFYDIPIGYLFRDKVEAKIQMPFANRSFRKKYVERLKQRFTSSTGPKIFLYGDNNIKIIESVSNIFLDNKTKFKQKLEMDLGCIIFENVDRYVNSKYTSEKFIHWINEYLNDDIHFIFHFANTNSPFIDHIKEKTNSFVIPFNKGILRNRGLLSPSLLYFKNLEQDKSKIIEKYNLDKQYFYDNSSDISIIDPLIEAGNIDKYFLSAKNLHKKVEKDKIYNKKLYYRSIGLLYTLQDLIINPSKYKFRYGDEETSWRFYTVPEFLEMFYIKISKENPLNQLILGEYITQIDNIYSELSKCKRFGEKSSFNRIGKDYRIFEIASNKYEYAAKESSLIIGSYSNSEASVLKKDLERFNIENTEVRHLGWLNKSNFDRSKYTLILPGPLPIKYFSELLRPYKKILVLSYEGYNCSRIKEQIKLVSDFSIKEEMHCMNYFKEIYEFVGIPRNDSLFQDFHERIKNVKIEKSSVKADAHLNSFENIKKLITKDSLEYKEDLDNLGQMIKNIKKADNESALQTSPDETAEFYLKNLQNGNNYRKSLPLMKTYFFLKSLGAKVEEGSTKDLKPGNFVVVIDNDEKKTLLELIIEMYDLESSVDKDVIEFWKERLMLFIKNTGIKYKQLYNIYKELGGDKGYQTILNWGKGNVIGPEDTADLQLIGKILDEEIIIDNHQLISDEIEKVRNIHRTTGRKLKNVIKTIIVEKDNLDVQNLNYEEYIIYEKVRNGIYEILEIS
ncbi:MAG: hypothetical protein ACP5C3_07320 [Methanomicrobiales archaeon]